MKIILHLIIETLNKVSTILLLTIVFFCIVTPVALIRRFAGADPLRLRSFGKSRESVFITRNHRWTHQDIKNLF